MNRGLTNWATVILALRHSGTGTTSAYALLPMRYEIYLPQRLDADFLIDLGVYLQLGDRWPGLLTY